MRDSCFDAEFLCAHIAYARPCVHVCVCTCAFLMKIIAKNFVHFRESRVTLVSDAWRCQSLCEPVHFGVTMAGNSSLEALPMGHAAANFFSIIIHLKTEKGQMVEIVWWRTFKVSIEICSWPKPDCTYLWWTGIRCARRGGETSSAASRRVSSMWIRGVCMPGPCMFTSVQISMYVRTRYYA